MRKIVVAMSVSLDGFMAGPDGELDWHLVDEELHRHFNDELRGMSAFLDGRVSYELMAEFWPTADAGPGVAGPVKEFAGIWREMPKFVFSRTLDPGGLRWNTSLRRSVDPGEIQELKARPGGDMALGGASLAAAFREQDLIDEYRLYVHPVLLGRGRPLFHATDASAGLRLAGTRTFGNGVVLLRHERDRDAAAA
ncbi:Dihydrofolate reductase [Streptomyces sp. WMMB 714]|uniref:dihydrofolate reductase family protein n=1 Tax=Streptomyces sp. WMMB 714 TaxID=1286822 RepID=UPI0005F81A68|nr:dihydrofolate reductase family protein [Streptomyces sp. WMMB 714]SCK55418.1 Dihydrofolate reductase [Streptomyces sp. WMMB 714]